MSNRLKVTLTASLCLLGAGVVFGGGLVAHADVKRPERALPAADLADGLIVTVKYDGKLVGLKGNALKLDGNPNEPGNMWRVTKASKAGEFFLENLASEAGPHWLNIGSAAELRYTRTNALQIVKLATVLGADNLGVKRGDAWLTVNDGKLAITSPGSGLKSSFAEARWSIVKYRPTLTGDGRREAPSVKDLSFKCKTGVPNPAFDACYTCPTDYKPAYPDVSHCVGASVSLKKGQPSSISNKRAWLDLATVSYYKCAKGYTHDPLLSADTKGVCFKVDDAVKTATKTSEKPQAGCSKGYTLDLHPKDVLNPQCFQCPKDTVRDYTKTIDEKDACVARTCGNEGGRPCSITERFPSCDAGLAENFLANKCVTNTVNLCTTVVNSIMVKSDPVVEKWLKSLAKDSKDASQAADKATRRALAAAGTTAANGPAKKFVTEAQRIAAIISGSRKGFDELFKASTFCGDPKVLLGKLKKSGFVPSSANLASLDVHSEQRLAGFRPGNELGQAVSSSAPAVAPHFYMSLGVSGTATAVVGEQLGLAIVTDFKDDLMTVFTVGPQLASDVGLAVTDSVMFYPLATADSFEGDISEFASWGWEVGFGGGEGAVGGIAVSYPSDMGANKDNFYSPTPNAVGFNFGVGVGLLPASGSVTASYSMLLTSTSL